MKKREGRRAGCSSSLFCSFCVEFDRDFSDDLCKAFSALPCSVDKTKLVLIQCPHVRRICSRCLAASPALPLVLFYEKKIHTISQKRSETILGIWYNGCSER
ncbi:hypothetical protein CLOSTMETH_00331 [[Clostridium] methylpentosum DSM 5476]|uniref:Uncharacterized protein n=1 Tax=[Clostridium] methylpentosum DSM 5476 TaxID=537013 RepID=C0E936_9FIRM|nr:hypothetical protein CLOSTMETH_00331 [[Clostridium] methylpentosum DSM 5476]